MLLIILALLTNISLHAQNKTLIGTTKYKDRTSIKTSEFSHRSMGEQDMFGDYTYGYGLAGLEINQENVSIFSMAKGGFSLFGWIGDETGIFPHLGVEMYNGDIRINSNNRYNNYILFRPSIAPGIQWSVGKLKSTINYKRGYTVSDYYVNGMRFKWDTSDGYAAYFEYKGLRVMYDVDYFAYIKQESVVVGTKTWYVFNRKDIIDNIWGFGIYLE